MGIGVGDALPEAKLVRMRAEGPEVVDLNEMAKGKIVVFAVPGAFTPTCHHAHMPSFVRNADEIRANGVDAIVCVSVNDAFVMKMWAESTGAEAAGIHVLADADGSFTKAMGMSFDAPPVGLMGRSLRYSMVVENGTVTEFNPEVESGTCEISGGDALVLSLGKAS